MTNNYDITSHEPPQPEWCHNGSFLGCWRLVPIWQPVCRELSRFILKADRASGKLACHFAVAEDEPSVDQDVCDPDGVLMRFEECGLVGDNVGIEDGHIGDGTGGQFSTVVPIQSSGGQAGHLPDRIFEFQHAALSDVVAQDPGVASVGPGVWVADTKLEDTAVGSDCGVRVGHDPIDVASGLNFQRVVDAGDAVPDQFDEQFGTVADRDRFSS